MWKTIFKTENKRKLGHHLKKKSPDTPDSKASCHKQTAAHNLETTV